MRCTGFFGHKWGRWENHLTKPVKAEDGKVYRQSLLKRGCIKCGYEENEWLPQYTLVKDIDENGEFKEDEIPNKSAD